MSSTIYDCVVLSLRKVHNRAGNITIVEGRKNLPFEVKRVFYLYDVPGGAGRGGHAHRKLTQLIIAASGSFNVLVDDGTNKKVVMLNRPDYGLLLVPGVCGELMEFSSGAVSLCLASELFDEQDYIRDYDEFIRYKHAP